MTKCKKGEVESAASATRSGHLTTSRNTSQARGRQPWLSVGAFNSPHVRRCRRLSALWRSAQPFRADRIRPRSFNDISSTSQAGGHPDLETSFSLAERRRTGGRQNVIFNAPQGLFGNTNAVTSAVDLRSPWSECPTDAQVGPDHRPRQLRRQPALSARHGADLRSGARGRRNGPLCLHRADSQHPDLDSRSRCGPAATTDCASPFRTSPS